MSDKYRKNTLPSTYIPVLEDTVLANVLTRLPRQSLVELCNKWPRMVNTQPHLNRSGLTQRQWNKVVMVESNKFKTDKKKYPKRKIIDHMVLDYWSNGLNVLQLSQIDCQLIVDKPNSHGWILSKVKERVSGKEVPIQLEPKKFLDMLSKDLNAMFMSYIYVCRHPKLPLIIIRLQVFDLQAVKTSRTSNRPHITSNRPYFVAIPINSPYIIHTVGNDLVTNILLQVVERNLPQTASNILTLETDMRQKPLRSLESMHILHGNSRFGNSLGPWTSYADCTIDASPLASLESHNTLNKPAAADLDIKLAANLKFKGSLQGNIKSSKLFDDIQPNKRRKKRSSLYITEEDDRFDENEKLESDEFASIAPIQNAEFLIQEKFNDDNYSSITLKLAGTDVFAGLHQLSVSSEQEEHMILNPYEVPSWLTGEEGKSCGTVKDGMYIK